MEKEFRECAICGDLSEDTLSVSISHRRAPVDGYDICLKCEAERQAHLAQR